jgi:nicotinate (nicotinamide) nucleotide adenylyltransferase
MNNKIKTIGIYGGAFNPITNAHIDIMKEVRKYVDELWVMPIGRHAFDKEMADSGDRIEMLKLAYNNYISKREIKNIRLNFQQTTYYGAKIDIPDDIKLEPVIPQSTYGLMNWLRNNYDGYEFYIVIGSDNADIIDKWTNYEKLLKENKFIIVNRCNSLRYDPNPKYFNNNNIIKIINDFGRDNDYKSSTEIREMIGNDNFIEANKYCPKKVVDYIMKHKLYMNENKFKIGLDFHNCITFMPDTLKKLSGIIYNSGNEVHIITGRSINDEFKKELNGYNIEYNYIFSITDYLENNGFKYKLDDKGGKVFDKDLWNNCKADYCRRKRIDIMIDDSEIYGKYFTTPYLQVKKGE